MEWIMLSEEWNEMDYGMKWIMESEVDFRVLQSTGWTNLAMQLICKTPVLRATFSENLSSIRSAFSSPLDDNNNKTKKKKKKMKQTCLPT